MFYLLKIFYQIYFVSERYVYYLIFLLRYGKIVLVLRGNGGAHKFIVRQKHDSFFVKKYSLLGDYWDAINKKYNDENYFNPPNIRAKLEVSEYIRSIEDLNRYAHISNVFQWRREVWYKYHENAVDYDFSSKAINLRVEKILLLFLSKDLRSEDHLSSNIMIQDKNIIVIDTDSFEHTRSFTESPERGH